VSALSVQPSGGPKFYLFRGIVLLARSILVSSADFLPWLGFWSFAALQVDHIGHYDQPMPPDTRRVFSPEARLVSVDVPPSLVRKKRRSLA